MSVASLLSKYDPKLKEHLTVNNLSFEFENGSSTVSLDFNPDPGLDLPITRMLAHDQRIYGFEKNPFWN